MQYIICIRNLYLLFISAQFQHLLNIIKQKLHMEDSLNSQNSKSQSHNISCLTEYFQYFKTTFSLQLSLLQCHMKNSQDSQSFYEFQSLISKIENKAYPIQFDYSPFSIEIQPKHQASIQRFYLRISQFLEFRLCKILTLENLTIVSKVQQFLKRLNKIFKRIEYKHKAVFENKEKISSLGKIFEQVNNNAIKFIQIMFQFLENQNKKRSSTLEQLSEAKSLIQKTFKIPLQNQFDKLQNQTKKAQKINFQNNFYNKMNKRNSNTSLSSFLQYQLENEDSYHQNSQILERTNYKIPLNAMYQMSYALKPKNNQVNRKSMNSIFGDNSQEQSTNFIMQGQSKAINIQKFPRKQNKKTLNQLLSILDIQPIQIWSKDYILNQLKAKNCKNKMMINSYTKKYTKKQRKYNRQIKKDKYWQNLKKFTQNQNDKPYYQQQNHSITTSASINLKKVKLNREKSTPTIKKTHITEQLQNQQQGQQEQSFFSNRNDSKNRIVLHKKQSSTLVMTRDTSKNQLTYKVAKKLQSNKSRLVRAITVNQNKIKELDENKDSFSFKEKEKHNFQSLKTKLHVNGGKISKIQKQVNLTQFQVYDKIISSDVINNRKNNNQLLFQSPSPLLTQKQIENVYSSKRSNHHKTKGNNFNIKKSALQNKSLFQDLKQQEKNKGSFKSGSLTIALKKIGQSKGTLMKLLQKQKEHYSHQNRISNSQVLHVKNVRQQMSIVPKQKNLQNLGIQLPTIPNINQLKNAQSIKRKK